jgi:hypothetical protein
MVRGGLKMFEYVEQVGTFLREMDPATKQMITGAIGTGIGMVAKPVGLWGWRTSKRGTQKVWVGIKRCFVNPPLGREMTNLVDRLKHCGGWMMKGDFTLIHPDGDAIDLEKRTYRRHGTNLTKCFAKYERKAMMRAAEVKFDELLKPAQDSARARM